MEIRNCLETDINVVYDLICELKNKELDYDKFKEAYRSKINDKRNYFILGREDNIVVGFLSLSIDYQLHHIGKVATVEELIINSNYRNSGRGEKLLENAVNYAKENNCDVIELSSNFTREQAHAFYEKNSFLKEGYKFKMELHTN